MGIIRKITVDFDASHYQILIGRGIINNMIKNKWLDVAITTCGALDHDIAKHFSNYKEGSFTMDDMELANQNIHRLGNILVPMDSYGPLIEEKMLAFLE